MSFTIHIVPGDLHFEADADTTLLRAAEDAGIELPSSCRNGTCRTCLSRIERGEVAYTLEWPGLTREEKAEGWTLPCVALARGDVVLEQPLAKALFD